MKLQNLASLKSLLFIGLSAGVLLIAPGARAQSLPNPLQDLQQQNNPNDLSSILNGNSGTGASSMMNLMNRIMLMDGRSYDEIAADQQESLNSEAAAFRKLQQQQMLQTTPSAQPQPQPQPLK